jgi:hypothetical protein
LSPIGKPVDGLTYLHAVCRSDKKLRSTQDYVRKRLADNRLRSPAGPGQKFDRGTIQWRILRQAVQFAKQSSAYQSALIRALQGGGPRCKIA